MADFALLSSHLKSNRLDGSTLRMLDRMLSSPKDYEEFQKLRSDLILLLKSESLTLIRNSADKPITFQLSTLDFFLRAFTILDDLQTVLFLRFKRLTIRESNAPSHPHLRVSSDEWMEFEEDASRNGLYSIATKARENAMSCLVRNGDGDRDNLHEKMTSIDRIDRLEDAPLQPCANHPNEDIGQVGRKPKANARKRSQKRKKNKGKRSKTGSFRIDKYVLEVCKELQEKRLFMVYNAIDILGLTAFQELVQSVRDTQAKGGQNLSGKRILWNKLEEKNPTAYQLVVERDIHLKVSCEVPADEYEESDVEEFDVDDQRD